MNYVEELKEFAVLHARAQGIRERTTRRILARVHSDDAAGRPGSWTSEWAATAQRTEARSRHLQAAALYGLARFPFVDGAARAAAQQGAVRCCERWRRRHVDSVQRTVTTPQGSFGYYASGVERATSSPALLILGGIISTKEQWAPLLTLSRRLGMPVAVTELPGVGENRLCYTPASAAQLSYLLDDLGAARGAYVLGMSFGGHLALRCAVADPRIRGIATVGAPIDAFFRASGWEKRVPLVTRRALAHATGVAEGKLRDVLPEFALNAELLAAVHAPVHYIASTRDEVVPREDVIAVARHLRDAVIVEFDDVHGSPHHLREVRASLALAVMRMSGRQGLRTRVLDAFLRLRGVTSSPSPA